MCPFRQIGEGRELFLYHPFLSGLWLKITPIPKWYTLGCHTRPPFISALQLSLGHSFQKGHLFLIIITLFHMQEEIEWTQGSHGPWETMTDPCDVQLTQPEETHVPCF